MSQGDGKVFAYVKLFRHPPGSSTWHEDLNSYKHVAEDDIELYRVVRDLDQNGVQKGKVIEISAIWRARRVHHGLIDVHLLVEPIDEDTYTHEAGEKKEKQGTRQALRGDRRPGHSHVI